MSTTDRQPSGNGGSGRRAPVRNLISKKKQIYPVSDFLGEYLERYGRLHDSGVRYENLLRYDNAVALYDEHGNDTLWSTVFYGPAEQREIHDAPPPHLRAPQVRRRPLHRRAPLRRPDRPLPLRQHAPVPRPDRQPAERELRLLLRQARRRQPGLRAGARAHPLAQPDQLLHLTATDAHRGAHHRHPRRRVHARDDAREPVRPGPPRQGVRQVQRALLRPPPRRHAHAATS